MSSNKQIVYFSRMFQAAPHLVQIYRQLGGVFVSNRPSTIAAVKQVYPEVATQRSFKRLPLLSQGSRSLSNADIIVTGAAYKDFLAPYPAKKVCVFHGTYMFFPPDIYQNHAHFDLLCFIGPRMAEMTKSYHPLPDCQTEVTGFLPFEEFPDCNADQRKSLLLHLGLAPEKKTVIYTPSSKHVGSFDLLVEDLIKGLPDGFNLIVRPHPRQMIASKSGRSQIQKLQKLMQRNKSVYVETGGTALSTQLAISDLVVSDGNSPMEESLYYDLPQLIIETDRYSRDALYQMGLANHINKHSLDKLVTLYDCGVGLDLRHESTRNIGALLERAIDDTDRFKDRRSAYFEWVFGKEKKGASLKVTNAIKSVLDEKT